MIPFDAREWLADIEDLTAFSPESDEDAEKLSDLCQPSTSRKFRPWMPYWTAEAYGFGGILRQFSGYPSFLPLCVETDHGPQFGYKPLKSELESDAPFMLMHNREAVKIWLGASNKPVFTMSSPFALYRCMNGIGNAVNARGTLVFPSHSTIETHELSSWDKYVEQLQELPEDFKPLAVCVYHVDIVKGRHLAFLNAGIPVLTAGHPFDPDFAKRFYRILERFQRVTSNEFGSYALYAVEMGIAFSLYGSPAQYWNESDSNLKLGVFETSAEAEPRIKPLFDGIQRQISSEQRAFVEAMLGLSDVPAPRKLRRVLYAALFKWSLRKIGLRLKRIASRIASSIHFAT